MDRRYDIDRFDAFGLETPFADARGEAFTLGESDPGESEFEEPLWIDRDPRSRNAPSPAPGPGPAPGPIPSGPGVRFPSGLVLNLAAGKTGFEEEHYDPNGVNLPLLDTGPHVQNLAISKNFKVREFVTSGGRPSPVSRISPDLVRAVQAIRDLAGKAVNITSGYRSYKRNVEVYAARNKRRIADGKKPVKTTKSQHSSGRAVDLKIKGMSGMALAKLAIDAAGPNIAIGLGSNFIHVDVRGHGPVWDYGGSTVAGRAEIQAYLRASKRKASPAPKPKPKPSPVPGPTPPAASGNRIVVAKVPLLKGHAGTPPDLIIRWNDIARSDVVDVVLHFHGYDDTQKERMRIDSHKERVSGLDLSDPAGSGIARARPTITLLIRGHHSPTASHAGAYFFPALFAKGALDTLIDGSLAIVGARFLKTFSRGRLILTAHSGGGAAISRVLAHADPDEIHLLDATYGSPKLLLDWAEARIKAEMASPAAVAPALRTVFKRKSGTQKWAQQLSAGLCALAAKHNASRLQPRFRVDATNVGHSDIPRRFGWQLLADAGGSLRDAATLACPGTVTGESLAWLDMEEALELEEENWLEALAEGELEDESYAADLENIGAFEDAEGEDFDTEAEMECFHEAEESEEKAEGEAEGEAETEWDNERSAFAWDSEAEDYTLSETEGLDEEEFEAFEFAEQEGEWEGSEAFNDEEALGEEFAFDSEASEAFGYAEQMLETGGFEFQVPGLPSPPDPLKQYRITTGHYRPEQRRYAATHKSGLILTAAVVGPQEHALMGRGPSPISIGKTLTRFEDGKLGQFVANFNEFTFYFDEVLRGIGRLRDLLSAGCPEVPKLMTALQKHGLRPTDDRSGSGEKKRAFRAWRVAQTAYAEIRDGELVGGLALKVPRRARNVVLARQAFWRAQADLTRTLAAKLDKPQYEMVSVKVADIASVVLAETFGAAATAGLVAGADLVLEAIKNRRAYDAKMKVFLEAVKTRKELIRDELDTYQAKGQAYWAHVQSHLNALKQRNGARHSARIAAGDFGQTLPPRSEARNAKLAEIRMPVLVADAWRVLAINGEHAVKKLGAVIDDRELVAKARFFFERSKPDPWESDDITRLYLAYSRAISWRAVLDPGQVRIWSASSAAWEALLGKFDV